MNRSVDRRTAEPMNGQKDKEITGPTDGRTDERTDKRTVGRTDYDFTIGRNDVDLSDVFEYD